MAIRDRFPFSLFRRRSVFQDGAGRFKTVIATGKGVEKGKVSAVSERSESSLKKYREYYEGENTVFAAINTTSWNAVMVGYNLISESVEAKVLIKRYLDALNFDEILLDNVAYTLIYGDSFIEIVRNAGGEITNLKTVDPITMNINYDKFGNITGYQQKIGGKLQDTVLKPEDIIHLRFFSIPSNPYGLSIIEPSKETIDRKISTDEALANAIIRHGTPKYKVKVGTENEIPPTAVFTDIQAELEDITEMNEIIMPSLVDITVLDEKGVPGIEEYSNMFQTQLVIGLMCPEEALGLGKGSTEATAKIKEIMYGRFIRSIQTKLASQMRRELINPILEKYGFERNMVTIKFNSVTDSDEAVKSKWLGNLLRGYPDGRHPFTVNEVRAMFSYPPVEGGDDLPFTEGVETVTPVEEVPGGGSQTETPNKPSQENPPSKEPVQAPTPEPQQEENPEQPRTYKKQRKKRISGKVK